MKVPVSPPDIDGLLSNLLSTEQGRARFMRILGTTAGTSPGGKYRHWDEFRHLPADGQLTADERWLAVKLARRGLYKALPLRDLQGRPFKYALPDIVLERLHRVDRDAAGTIEAPAQVTNPQTRDTYLLRSVAEEAITSSQLEGASTTRRVAKEMLLEGRTPRDRSERMIANNYQAMQWVREQRNTALTPALVTELQRMLTEETLDDPTGAGRYRTGGEIIHVTDEIGTTLHIPPPAAELEGRVRAMCEFANDTENNAFVHPVIRAILLHFWLAYDHPFVDGNGRTARALFYWSMARQGYWLCEYVSISRILKRAKSAYARAFLFSESDDNDATYFIVHQLRVLLQAIDALYEYLQEYSRRVDTATEQLRRWRLWSAQLNQRQLAVMEHALRNPDASYTIEAHQRTHGTSYQTARTDLLSLGQLGLLEKGRLGRGRAFAFRPSAKLRDRIAR